MLFFLRLLLTYSGNVIQFSIKGLITYLRERSRKEWERKPPLPPPKKKGGGGEEWGEGGRRRRRRNK